MGQEEDGDTAEQDEMGGDTAYPTDTDPDVCLPSRGLLLYGG